MNNNKKKSVLINKPISIDYIRRLKHENLFLKDEIREEKEKFQNTIATLHKELNEVKEDNRKLINEVEHYVNTKENKYNTL